MTKESFAEGMDESHCSRCKSFFLHYCHEKKLCIYGANRNDPLARDMFKPNDRDERFVYTVKPIFSKIWRG